jgi:hypothetical protein
MNVFIDDGAQHYLPFTQIIKETKDEIVIVSKYGEVDRFYKCNIRKFKTEVTKDE